MNFLRRLVQERPWLLIVALLAAFLAGLQLGGPPPASGDQAVHEHAEAEEWTCSMHPNIRQPGPGKCPICGMDLIPVSQGGADLDPNRLEMTPSAKRLAEIETTPVQRRFASNTVRLKGQVIYDETLLETLTAWVPGRLDELYVDYVGIQVEKGQHLAQMYSPEIYVAEKELQEAALAVEEAKDGHSTRALQSAREILDATRDKLRLWGVPESVVRNIAQGAKPSDRIDIVSPVGGIVVKKMVNAGEYVQTGTPLYSIAELDEVWVALEAYESDLPWLRFGQKVEVRVPSLPGETLRGTISLIDPVFDPQTRTVRVRVDVPNPDQKLKPGMLATGVVESQLAANGRVMEPDLAGKWISPMHPEIVKDQPGECDICGMPLVPAEQLGFAAAADEEPPLVIPATSLLFTGTRSIVYVEVPGQDKPTYELREVEVGARAGDDYIILHGLSTGEMVVTHGNFKIDSAMQLQARSSMMSRPGQGQSALAATRAPKPFLRDFDKLLTAYLELQTALVSDDLSSAQAAVRRTAAAFGDLNAEALDPDLRDSWSVEARQLESIIDETQSAEDLDSLRRSFADLSQRLLMLVGLFGHGLDRSLVQIHCPMAFSSRGAEWLQAGDEVENPYLGQKMPDCGNLVQSIGPRPVDGAPAPAAPSEHRH